MTRKVPEKSNNDEPTQQCEIVRKCCVVMQSCDCDPCMDGTFLNATSAHWFNAPPSVRFLELVRAELEPLNILSILERSVVTSAGGWAQKVQPERAQQGRNNGATRAKAPGV